MILFISIRFAGILYIIYPVFPVEKAGVIKTYNRDILSNYENLKFSAFICVLIAGLLRFFAWFPDCEYEIRSAHSEKEEKRYKKQDIIVAFQGGYGE